MGKYVKEIIDGKCFINGKCSLRCDIYLDGDCEDAHDLVDLIETEGEQETHDELYGFKDKA